MTRKQVYYIIAFLYPILSYFRINLIGQFAVGDFVVLFSFLDFKKTTRLFVTIADIKKIAIAYLVFLLAQMMSDWINHSDFVDMARGWANILMAILVTVFFIGLFNRNPKYFILFLLGSVLRYVLLGDTNNLSNSAADLYEVSDMGIFKFRIAPMLNALLLIFSWYLLQKSQKQYFNVIILFILYGLFCMAFDFRSNGITFMLSALILYCRPYVRNTSLRKMLPYLFLSLLVFQGLYALYVSSVIKGEMGGEHSVKQIKMADNSYNPLNLILVGRSEFFVGLKAALDKPIFGQGSWAKDPLGYYTFMMLKLHGEDERFLALEKNMNGQFIIPSHSVLIGAWMNAGVMGLLSVLYIFVLFINRSIRLLRNAYFQKSAYYPILVYSLLNGIWVFFFSPLPEIKTDLAVIIAFVVAGHQAVAKTIQLQHQEQHKLSLIKLV
ncbi:hypothetical protein ACDQ55_20240 [Chitinophaga sp. 30R24]|uniref:hypothetical protein n=1 Tax=Chitinophaga sp. 30R24 TaxID=3248838 RepID=UPI003B8F69B4